MIRIKVFRGRELVADRASPGPACCVGRDPQCLVVLQGWRIGRRQLQFSCGEQGLFVRDGGGMAPVRVDGKEIVEYGPLAGGDSIELGEYRVQACLEDGPAAQTASLGAPDPVPDPVSDAVARRTNPLESPEGMAMRAQLHRKLIAAMDLRRVDVARMADPELRAAVRGLIEELIDADPAFDAMRPLRAGLRDVVLDEIVGLGPLEALLADDAVTEIMVNRHSDIFVERGGRLHRADISFSDDAAVLAAIERIVSPLGRRIDESSPMVDARLKDGSRVNAIIPPLAIKGPCLTIRKFARNKLTEHDLVRCGALDRGMVAFLRVAVRLRANIVVSGGTGSGKTTLLNVLSNFIPDDERIVTVEDAAELQLNQPNLVALEARPANIEGRGAVAIRDLVRNCLRMRPDRIIVGECRGGEALDMLQAMNTGHDGSLTTAHANSPRDCLSRLEVMALMSGLEVPVQAIREQIASAVDVIVQQTRFSCGTRKVTHITEVTGIEGNLVQMQDIFRFEQDGFGDDDRVRGRFAATGHVPDFYRDLLRRGVQVDLSIFGNAAAPGREPSPCAANRS
ncbi:Flp pilus assembly complex ATPase component TadA [Massilia forsythiae]|uniref:Flp pilus assembly complex ATPase component TadA n=1 Tax=Massilia forsythiae TaxID=2728020 RepID=A0A7Z2ZUD7_9BURK|nr:ATPase, T2SS/T4P/T4SS family [Massilia forsythiae]QJE02319.1 Flp pilus assembly complex ATPase component TadA [Massilia forsythiae]